MKTKVYSVFPACGKTWLCKHQDEYGLKILDSDSSYFSWIWEYPENDERGMYSPNARKTKDRNPSFPQNYIDHIKSKVKSGQYDFIFVSSHASVRDALEASGIDFTIVYPSVELTCEWIGRCYFRCKKGESGCNPDVLFDNWLQWINECEVTGCAHDEIVLNAGEYLSDYIIGNGEFMKGYQQALKDINRPMAVITEKWNPSMCPRCKESFYDFEPCFDGYYNRATNLDRCPFCGQRLDWDKGE